MTAPPLGSPCWADLWTSDVEGSGRFYGELFGWEAQEPSPEFGGYFMFTRDGVPVAGGMGDMGDDEGRQHLEDLSGHRRHRQDPRRREAGGAQIIGPAMPVADLGTQAVLIDPTGAASAPGSPGRSRLHASSTSTGRRAGSSCITRDYASAVAFYQLGRSAGIRRSSATATSSAIRRCAIPTARGVGRDHGRSGVPGRGPAGPLVDLLAGRRRSPPRVAKVKELGGSVVQRRQDTPTARLATVTDPAGAVFKLRTPPSNRRSVSGRRSGPGRTTGQPGGAGPA